MEKEIKDDYFALERVKDRYLKDFKREVSVANEIFAPGTDAIADEIVALLKTKELTYEEAYAVLQLAYRQLKYESNFLILR